MGNVAFDKDSAKHIARETRRWRDDPVKLVGPEGPVILDSGAKAKFGKLDAALAFNGTATVSVYSDPSTDTGVNITGVKPLPTLTSGTIPSGAWVELKKWGASWYAFPLPSEQTVKTDLQLNAVTPGLEAKSRLILAAPAGAESAFVEWADGDECP